MKFVRIALNSLMLAGCLLVLLSVIMAWAATADTDAPLTGGTIQAHWGWAPFDPDALATVSISMQVVGTTTPVFCQEVVLGEVQGPSDIIPATAQQVFVEGIAWSGAGCTGIASLPSVDKYIVTFAGPGPPVLIPAP